MINPLEIEKVVKGKSQQLEKSQAMTSFKLFSHLEPLGLFHRIIPFNIKHVI